jgi:hypothetical protein
MLSSNWWPISITTVLLGFSIPQSSGLVYDQAVIQPDISSSHPNAVLEPWPHGFCYSFQPEESIDDESTTNPVAGPRNGSIWLYEGFPTDIGNCKSSGGLGPPKKISLPPDVCLYGTQNNLTFLLNGLAVCDDDTLPWLAMYADPTCHATPRFVNPKVILPGKFCLTTPPFFDEVHIIMQFSMIFRCVDSIERSMPAKLHERRSRLSRHRRSAGQLRLQITVVSAFGCHRVRAACKQIWRKESPMRKLALHGDAGRKVLKGYTLLRFIFLLLLNLCLISGCHFTFASSPDLISLPLKRIASHRIDWSVL